MVFVTLKMPKSLINNEMRAARPGGSKPPPSLGVRPRLALKVVEGAFCCSVRVRATKRRRRIFSLGRCHDSDRGERNREARSSRKKWSRESSAVLCECERRNVGDVYSPWGDVTIVTEGNEAGRPELAQKVVEGVFCCSVRVRATKRRRRIFSLGRSHASDRGMRSREARSSRKKWSRESSAVLRACERPNVGDVYSPWGDVTIVTEG